MVTVVINDRNGNEYKKMEHIERVRYKSQLPNQSDIDLHSDEDIFNHEFKHYQSIVFYSSDTSYIINKQMIGDIEVRKES